MRGRTHSREFKLSIVRQLASGEKRPAQVCREHNLAASMVSHWRQEYETRGEAAFASPEPTPTQAVIYSNSWRVSIIKLGINLLITGLRSLSRQFLRKIVETIMWRDILAHLCGCYSEIPQ